MKNLLNFGIIKGPETKNSFTKFLCTRGFSSTIPTTKFKITGETPYGPENCRKIDTFLAEYKPFRDHDKKLREHFKLEAAPWQVDALRLKSWDDIHNLWYVLLRERNMLLTMRTEIFYRINFRNGVRGIKLYEKSNSSKLSQDHPLRMRLEMVKTSMKNIKIIINERYNAWLGAHEMWEIKQKGLDPLKPEIMEKLELKHSASEKLKKFHQKLKYQYKGKFIPKKLFQPEGYEFVKDINEVPSTEQSDLFHIIPQDEHKKKRYDYDFTPIQNRRHKSRRRISKFREHTKQY
jgi:hypothetical protein